MIKFYKTNEKRVTDDLHRLYYDNLPVISLAVACFLLGTKQTSFKGFNGWRIARWFLTIPLIMLEEILSKKGK